MPMDDIDWDNLSLEVETVIVPHPLGPSDAQGYAQYWDTGDRIYRINGKQVTGEQYDTVRQKWLAHIGIGENADNE